MGTTGEANSFDTSERKAILESVVNEKPDFNRILVGTGCCSITESVELSRHALQNGVNHVLILPPFYYRNVSDEGLYQYFDQFIHKVNNPDLRIYLYHFPKMTGLPFSHDLIERLLADFPDQIEGIKDSSGDWDNMSTMLDRFPRFRVFAGSEVFLLDLLKKGGPGAISASANVTSLLAADVYKNANNDNAEFLQEKLTLVRKMIEKSPMIPMLKLLMSQIEGDENWINIRPPLTPLSLWNENEVNDILNHIRVPQ